MVYQILISSKTLIPFIRLSNYAFHREDISFSKHVLSDTCHGKIVQYSERIVVTKTYFWKFTFAKSSPITHTQLLQKHADNIHYVHNKYVQHFNRVGCCAL